MMSARFVMAVHRMVTVAHVVMGALVVITVHVMVVMEMVVDVMRDEVVDMVVKEMIGWMDVVVLDAVCCKILW